MNILGKELSEKTASLIKEITQCLSKPVEYRFTDPSKTSSYGQCDAVILYNRCNRYLVAKRHTGRKEYTDSLLLRWIIRAPVSYFLQPLLLEVNPCTAVEARHHRGIFFARTPQVIIHSFRWLHSRIGKTHSASLLILQAPGVVAWSLSLISLMRWSSIITPP